MTAPDRLQALSAALNRIDLKHAPIRTSLSLKQTADGIRLVVTLHDLADRDTGSVGSIAPRGIIPDDLPVDSLPKFVHHAVATAWLHELNEAFHVDGERILDPHAACVHEIDLRFRFLRGPAPRGWSGPMTGWVVG